MEHSLEALADRVSDYLSQMDLEADQSDEGIHLLRYGSTVVMISMFQEGDQGYVRFAATVLVDVRPKLELVTRLLRLNTEVLFGAFLLFDDDTVSFAHTLTGAKMDLEEFRHALEYVARVSDDHDEELQAIAGGARAEDLLNEDRG